jgi:hypothetical protein
MFSNVPECSRLIRRAPGARLLLLSGRAADLCPHNPKPCSGSSSSPARFDRVRLRLHAWNALLLTRTALGLSLRPSRSVGLTPHESVFGSSAESATSFLARPATDEANAQIQVGLPLRLRLRLEASCFLHGWTYEACYLCQMAVSAPSSCRSRPWATPLCRPRFHWRAP